MHTLLSPYSAAVNSFLNRAVSSWSARILILTGLFYLAMGAWLAQMPNGSDSMMLFLSLGYLWLAGALWIHLREALVNPRASITPRFCLPHVLAFVSLALPTAVALPASMLLWGPRQSLAWMALLTLLFAAVGWWVLTMSRLLTVLIIAFCVWVGAGSGGKAVISLLMSHGGMPAIAVLIAGLLGSAWAIYKLATLSEEDAWYHARLQGGTWSMRPRATGEVNDVWKQAQRSHLFGWSGARRHVPVVSTTAGLWARSGRWRALNGGTTAFTIAIACGNILMIALFSRAAPTTHAARSPVLTFWMLFMPATMVAQSWLRMWRFLEIESLRPVARSAFLAELALAMAVQIFKCWLVLATAVVTAALLFQRSHLDHHYLVIELGAALMLQVAAFGAAVWFLRYRSAAWSLLTMALLTPAGIFLTAASDPNHAGYRSGVVIVAIASAIGGVLLLRDASRRWLVTELG